MATTIAELLVEIGGSVEGAKKAEDQIDGLKTSGQAAGQSLEKDLGGGAEVAGVQTVALGNLVAQGVTALAGLALQAIKTGAAFAIDLVTGFAAAGDEIAKTSKQLGVGAQSLQRLTFAAERSGVSSASLQRSIRTLQVGLIDAREKGVGPAADGLALLGLQLEDIPVDDAEAAFGVISDALQNVESEAERSSIAADLFGQRAGIELKSLLVEGSEGIRELGDRAEELGGVLGEDALGSAEQLTDAFTDLQTLFDGVKNQIGSALAPTITVLVDKITDFVAENDDLIQQDIPKLFEALADLLPPVLKFTSQLVDGVAFLVTEFERFNEEADAGIGYASELRDVFTALTAPIRTLIDLISKAAKGLSDLADQVDVISKARDRARDALGLGPRDVPETNRRVSATEVAAEAGSERAQQLLAQENERLLQAQLQAESDAERAFFEAQQAKNKAGVERERQRLAREGKSRKGRRGGRGGGRAAATAEQVVSDVTFEDVLRGVIGGRGNEIAQSIRGLASRTPRTDQIKPTVAIDFFNFQVTQNITGESDPAEIGRQAAQAIRQEFQTQTARAGTTLASNIVR